MFRNAFGLGRLFGVEIRMNWSVSVIFALIVFHLAVGLFPYWHPTWSPALLFSVALIAAVVFFLSLLAHELAHALTARAFDIPVGSITLFLFGGVSDIQRNPDRPGVEALIAGVGPLVSGLLGLAFILGFGLVAPEPETAETALGIAADMGPAATILAWAGPINVLLAIFNLLPAFPLDGGRILRAILWWWNDNLSHATRWAAMLSKGFSYGLIALGLLMAFGLYVPYVGGGPVAGLWLVFIGWFLTRAADGTYTRQVISDALQGVDVERLTDRDILIVPPETTVGELVDEFASRRPQEMFPVADDEGFQGTVHVDELRQIPAEMWDHTRVTYAMTPADEDFTIDPDSPADEALDELTRRGADEAVVRHDDEIIGLLHQDNILRWVRMHAADSNLRTRHGL